MSDLAAIASAERDLRAAKAIAAWKAGELTEDQAQHDHAIWCSIAELFAAGPYSPPWVDNADMVAGANRAAEIAARQAERDPALAPRAFDLARLARTVSARVHAADAINAALRARRERIAA